MRMPHINMTDKIGKKESSEPTTKFLEDFMFQLTKDECLRSQIATLNKGREQHLK